jgi:hypothetical protein
MSDVRWSLKRALLAVCLDGAALGLPDMGPDRLEALVALKAADEIERSGQGRAPP